MRVLITGSRRWRDETVIWDALTGLARDTDPSEVTVVHGGAVGVDRLADRAARELGMCREVHKPVNADRPDRFRIRNQAMVNIGADLCLAFANSWASGTGMCARMARAAGIRTVDYGVNTEARPGSLMQLREQVVALVRDRGHEWRAEPFELASGQLSHDYVDGKYAIDSGSGLRLASRAAAAAANSIGASFDAVGGPTMGAEALAHGIAMVADCLWFSVRSKPKSRGREQWIEGNRLKRGTRVLLVDDVVSTGDSIMKAYDQVMATGATVVGAVVLVDRGESGRRLFAERGVPYRALVTYNDLGIERIHV